MNGFTREMNTPIGPMMLIVDDQEAVVSFDFMREQGLTNAMKVLLKNGWHLTASAEKTAAVARQIEAWFQGETLHFDLNLSPIGTDFQKRVWCELSKIPFGEVISYGELAKRIGNPKASRGVGSANGKNPISVIVPCHRVIGANGKLTGYGGGLEKKEWLLAFEKRRKQQN